ncbi:unnamed protein product [Leptidea sinapis]|uniref:Peptidase S1 domain-containing protein n=2 Tax=Leptidea sinapis TaxID=189913 RepID=A0A5E4R3D9_9NEOP|nr:unnamed protein product [Leptidea sinapis]
MAVTTTVQSDETCYRSFFSRYTSRMICTERSGGGYNPCDGDSGGPLVETASKKQVGIVSFGIADRCASAPLAYISMANPEIRDWVTSITGV